MEERKRKENEKLKEEECEVCFQKIVKKNEELWKENKKRKQMIILIQNIEKNLQLQKELERVDKRKVYIYNENSGIYDMNQRDIKYDLLDNYYRQKVNRKIECCSIQLCIQCKYEWYCRENCSVCQKQYKNFEQFRILNMQIIKKRVNVVDMIPEIIEKKQEYSPLLRMHSVQNMDSGNKIEKEFYNNKNGLNIITCKKKQKNLKQQDPEKEVKEGQRELLGKQIVQILYKKKIRNIFDGRQVREFKENIDLERQSIEQEDIQQYNLQNYRNNQRRNGKIVFLILLLFLVVIIGMLTIAIMEMRRNINN